MQNATVKKILIIEDDPSLVLALRTYLIHKEYEITFSASGKDGLMQLEKDKFQLVILDLHLPDQDGTNLISTIQHLFPRTKVIVITGDTSKNVELRCMRDGAYGFLIKPFNHNALLKMIQNAIADNEVLSLSNRHALAFDFVMGNSKRMEQVYELLEHAIESQVTILLTGESGTGKEIFAKLIHFNSVLNNRPFVAVNCAAIPETLIESELFGYEKGAFTGADEQKIGKFELANGGTIFLDEVSELPLQAQAKLLRVIQEREIVRISGDHTIPINVRIISSTNRDLRKEILDKRFREDLYFRVSTYPLDIPPLRERPEDIPQFVNHFLRIFNRSYHKNIKELTPDTLEAMLRHPWLGNIRELENVVQRAVILTQGTTVHKSALPAEFQNNIKTAPTPMIESSSTPHPILPWEEEEKRIINNALQYTKGNIKQAAEALVIDRTTLYRKIKSYEIKDYC